MNKKDLEILLSQYKENNQLFLAIVSEMEQTTYTYLVYKALFVIGVISSFVLFSGWILGIIVLLGLFGIMFPYKWLATFPAKRKEFKYFYSNMYSLREKNVLLSTLHRNMATNSNKIALYSSYLRFYFMIFILFGLFGRG